MYNKLILLQQLNTSNKINVPNVFRNILDQFNVISILQNNFI